MDELKKITLKNSQKQIVKDLKVSNVLDDLYQQRILTDSDIEEIEKLATEDSKNKLLLNIILIHDSDDVYEKFITILEKNYDWLAKLLKDTKKHNPELEEKIDIDYENALVRGDVPLLPKHYITRTSSQNELYSKLEKLQRGHSIIIHGMTGMGKTCLATAAVRDKDLLTTYFNNHVYWLDLSKVDNEEKIMEHFTDLYEKLKIYENTSRRHSYNIPTDLKNMRYRLNTLFMESKLKDALLVLDSVESSVVIKHFNLNCKILMTTCDTSEIKSDGRPKTFILVNSGFTESESLLLFSKCLNKSVSELPKEAKKIHTRCKGGPLAIHMIASCLEQSKHDVDNPKRWNYYVQKLSPDKINFNNKNGSYSDQLNFNTIVACVEDSPSELRQYIISLALFMEDINIMPQVLQTIWNLDEFDVEHIMKNLENRSLVASEPKDYKNYKCEIYGIHILISAYLKKMLSQEEKIELHRNLIESYCRKCKYNFANLPDDNYIYSYIGYHLYEAKLLELFPKLYLDLSFIGAKIKAVGVADVEADLKQYEEYIIDKNEKNKFKFEEIQNFVSRKGQDLKKYSNTDVIQSALQEPISSIIYNEAIIKALENVDQVYFDVRTKNDHLHTKTILDVPQDVNFACYTYDNNQILIGTNNGQIQLWNQIYKNQLNNYSGHVDKITSVVLRIDGKEFLSTSDDGTVKIWTLDDIKYDFSPSSETFVENDAVYIDKTRSPRLKQNSWSSFYENTSELSDQSRLSLHTSDDPFICAAYSFEEADRIACGSKLGFVYIFDSDDGKLLSRIDSSLGRSVSSVTFTLYNKLIIFACEKVILVYSADTMAMLSSFHNTNNVKHIMVVPHEDNKIIAICNNTIELWSWKYQTTELIENPSKSTFYTDKDVIFTCGTVTLDGKYVITNTSDNTLFIWDIETLCCVTEIPDRNGFVLSLNTFLIESNLNATYYKVLSASNDKAIKQWKIYPTDLQKNQSVDLKEPSVAFYDEKSKWIFASADTENRIQIYEDLVLTRKTDVIKQVINELTVCPKKMKIAYGCVDGHVYEYCLENYTYKCVIKLPQSVAYLKYLDDVFLIAASNFGDLIVRRKDVNKCLSESKSTSIKINPIVQCFYYNSDHFLSVHTDGSIKYWDCNKDTPVILVGGSKNKEITTTSLSSQNDLIAIISEKDFTVYRLKIENNAILSAGFVYSHTLKETLRSCCFSPDGNLIAIGQNNGNIQLWSLKDNCIMSELKLHHTAVRYLCFNPDPFPQILVSIGEQIAWWDVELVKKDKERFVKSRNRGSGRFKNSTLMLDESMYINGNNVYSSNVWQGYKGRKNKPELLACIKLDGLYANKVYTSRDFKSFKTIDNIGHIYILNVFKPELY